MTNEPTDTLYTALLAVQKAAPALRQDGTAQYGSYTTLGELIRVIRPLLNENDLVVSQFPSTGEDGTPALRSTITHAPTGESISDVTPLPLPDARPHTFGGALTYIRRYSLSSMLGLVGDDDDDAGSIQAASKGSVRAPKTTPAVPNGTPQPSPW